MLTTAQPQATSSLHCRPFLCSPLSFCDADDLVLIIQQLHPLHPEHSFRAPPMTIPRHIQRPAPTQLKNQSGRNAPFPARRAAAPITQRQHLMAQCGQDQSLCRGMDQSPSHGPLRVDRFNVEVGCGGTLLALNGSASQRNGNVASPASAARNCERLNLMRPLCHPR